jgi:hypothetical protein
MTSANYGTRNTHGGVFFKQNITSYHLAALQLASKQRLSEGKAGSVWIIYEPTNLICFSVTNPLTPNEL